ncbi:hypothetical protein V502_09399 [Pseudogymnoascus sp. VKM F-4520 (FW-2644)]|nr:hypothetical protein V502_09399 [Pseudogymnoascus sp. VKM F-4520 (FW-2644)]
MATNPGDGPRDGPPFNGRQTLKGFPYNDQDASQDDEGSNPQQTPSSSSKTTKIKNFFKGSLKSSKSDKPGKSDNNTGEKKKVTWTFPESLEPPTPMQILQIMEASPEHQLKLLAMEKAKNDAELEHQSKASRLGHSQASQSTESGIISPATDMKWSFDGKSVLNYKKPGQSRLDQQRYGEPGTPVPQGMWQAVPHATYQSEMVSRMGDEYAASTSGPAVWSNVKGVGASGASFPGGNNPSQQVHQPQSERCEPLSHPIDMSLLQTPYEIAEAAYLYGREGSKTEWIVYLDGYREGQFNIMKPPKPPLMDPLFSYLPSMLPLNEAGRLLSLFNLEREWTPWQEERGRELIKASIEEFEATGVSISLIDQSNEIIKAEIGYNRRMIKRSVSIAAHVLLTTEVLVVLDARKDWRFAKNPLVVDDPEIRFFAGAPILSQNCEVVGVFAIFGREPRGSFSALQRRSLSDYGAMCAAQLNTVIETSFSEQTLSSLQAQVNTEVWDPTYLQSEPKPKVRSLWMHEDTHRMLCGEPREDETDSTNYPTTFEELMERVAIDSTDEDTVHHPEEQFQGPYMNGAQANFTYSSIYVNPSTPAKERDAVESDYPLLGSDNEGPDSPLGGQSSSRSESPASERFVWRPDSPTSQGFTLRPESPVMRSLTPRPYSGSDLTSVDGNFHPNTPTGPEFGGSRSPSQRVQDVLDRTASVLQSESPEVQMPLRRQRKKSIRSISQYEEELKRLKIESEIREAHSQATRIDGSNSTAVTGSSNASEQPSTQATTPLTSFNTRMSTLEFADTHRRPEADAAAMTVARKLGFNRVYVAEIFPNSDLMTPGGLAVTGMGVRILASYNCPQDMILDTDIHLQVLRSSLGAMKWHDKDALPGDTNKGLLIRLHSKGSYGVPRHLHTGGIVYGAIDVAQLKSGEDAGITDQEQAVLVDAANEMKLILFKRSDKRDRKDSTPAAAAKTEGAGPNRSIPAPAIETPKVEDDVPEHPNSISAKSMREASEAVSKLVKFNMDEEMSPQW